MGFELDAEGGEDEEGFWSGHEQVRNGRSGHGREGNVPWRTWVKRVQTRDANRVPMPARRTRRETGTSLCPRTTYLTKIESTPFPTNGKKKVGSPTTYLEPRQQQQNEDHPRVDPRPDTRPTNDLPAPITRQSPMFDSVLGEPWPVQDGEFGVCVGQGAGLAHASRDSVRKG